MKKFLIVLIGLIGAYLITVGGYNSWNFLAGLEPSEIVERLFSFAWTFAISAFFTWFILSGLFRMD